MEMKMFSELTVYIVKQENKQENNLSLTCPSTGAKLALGPNCMIPFIKKGV